MIRPSPSAARPEIGLRGAARGGAPRLAPKTNLDKVPVIQAAIAGRGDTAAAKGTCAARAGGRKAAGVAASVARTSTVGLVPGGIRKDRCRTCRTGEHVAGSRAGHMAASRRAAPATSSRDRMPVGDGRDAAAGLTDEHQPKSSRSPLAPGRLAVDERDRDVAHRRIGLGAVPMTLAGLDMSDVAYIDLALLVFCRHDARP